MHRNEIRHRRMFKDLQHHAEGIILTVELNWNIREQDKQPI